MMTSTFTSPPSCKQMHILKTAQAAKIQTRSMHCVQFMTQAVNQTVRHWVNSQECSYHLGQKAATSSQVQGEIVPALGLDRKQL